MIETIKKNSEQLVQALDDAKGLDVKAFEVTNIVSYADWVVIVSANSNPHMKHLVRVADDTMHQVGVKARGIEGAEDESGWILIDYGDIVLHIFTEEQREFYQLEKLFIS